MFVVVRLLKACYCLASVLLAAGLLKDKTPAQRERHVWREWISWEFALWSITGDDMDWDLGMDAISTWIRDHPIDWQMGSCRMCLGRVFVVGGVKCELGCPLTDDNIAMHKFLMGVYWRAGWDA